MELQMSQIGDPPDGMYPMRVVTRLTGLSADTIRVWERRYGAVIPKRTEGNARRYSAEDVRRLTLLREATIRGHAISEVARLEEPALRRIVDATTPTVQRLVEARSPEPESKAQATPPEAAPQGAEATPQPRTVTPMRPAPPAAAGPSPLDNAPYGRFCREYLDTIQRFEVRRGADMLSSGSMLLGPRDVVFEIVLPTLREVGRRCAAGLMSVAHEHLVSVQLKGLLTSLMRLPAPAADAPRVLIATPSDHLHEFGALIASFLAASRGFDAIYLGPDLPERDLASAIELSEASLLVLSVARDMSNRELADFADTLGRLTRDVEVWLGMPPGHAAGDLVRGVRFFDAFEALDEALAQRMTAEDDDGTD